MEFLNRLDLRPKTILKIFGLVFLGLVLLGLAFQIIGASFRNVASESINSLGMAPSYSKDMAYSEQAAGFGLSSRNIAPVPMPGPAGADSEDFEVTEYRATVETRRLSETCAALSSLKAKSYVIFENASEYDRGCNYNFKVEKGYKEEILMVIEGLGPKDLSENTETIKRLVDDFTSEEEILKKKKETVESTLNDAIASYDEIARIATQARDAESLAKIIDSKIRIIESLSQQRLSISEQLDRLGRAKAEQLDRLEYVYFYVNVYENKFIDREEIVDSWKEEVRNFVREANEIFQNSSIGLIKITLYILQFALYLLILVVAGKYGWKLLKKIWGKKGQAIS